MRPKRWMIALAAAVVVACIPLSAREGPVTEKEYRRAEAFLPRNLAKKVYNLEVSPRWIDEGARFWYRTNTREGKRFRLVDPKKKEKRDAFDHESLARLLSARTGKTYEAGKLPFDTIRFVGEEKDRIEFDLEDKTWTFDPEKGELTSRKREVREEPKEKASPDGKWTAFTRDFNLYVRRNATGNTIQLSTGGQELYAYATRLGWGDLIEGENGLLPLPLQVEWSPDSTKIYTQILDLRRARKMYLLQSVSDGFRSRLLSYYRASPGDVNVPYLIPVVFDIESLREVRVDMNAVPHFLGLRAEWSEDGEKLIALKFDRGYKAVNLLEIDAETGEVRTVVRDENRTCVETGLVRYRAFPASGQAFLTSERDGWNHIYRFDWKSGKLLNQVTKGEYVVLNILDADEKARTITFSAAGKEKGEDPYLVHLYRVGFDGSGLTPLTPENAFHGVSLSPDKSCFVDNVSRVDLPTVSLLRRLEDGEVIMELEKADIQDLLAEGWRFPEAFKAKAADGRTDIYGLIWRPSRFDPSRKYPVIDQTYTGPQAVATPKTFRRALMSGNTALAELGFVCVTVDGRGTGRRSKAFHDYSYQNLGGGCLDHIAAIKVLAEKFPYMDAARVGIYGHSAGGYDTVRAMLEWPDFYKVGVSSSGNHDHRMAKAWWPEQYMGWPVGDFYGEQSNITNAGKLKGKLLLVHGELDENVNPAATFRLVDALIKHNKDFDLLILPGNHHGYRGVYGDYFTRKRWDFFVRHLHGQEPPAYRITAEEEN